MKLLLDTHIALWAVTGHARMPQRAFDMMIDPDNETWVSAIAIWETAIKFAKRQRRDEDALMPGAQARDLFVDAGFFILEVNAMHAAQVDHLPPIHADPFDRMLVAQAVSEPMYLLTSDWKLAGYGEHVMLV